MEFSLGLQITIGISVAGILLGLFCMWFDWACPDDEYGENFCNSCCCCLPVELRTNIIDFLDTNDDPLWPPMATRPTTEVTRISATSTPTSTTVVDNTEDSPIMTQPNDGTTTEITEVSHASTIPIQCAATTNEITTVSATPTPASATVVDITEASPIRTLNVATTAEFAEVSSTGTANVATTAEFAEVSATPTPASATVQLQLMR